MTAMFREKIILIMDSNGRDSQKYKGILGQNPSLKIINADKTENAFEIIEKHEPDLILAYDNFDEDMTIICKEIRNRKSILRPVLVVLSDKEHLDKKIDVIKAGADDFQNINTGSEEISLRLFAHLRRQEEVLLDSSTGLPGANTTYKVIKRNVEPENNRELAIMAIDIDNFPYYKDIYGYIAAEKLIQTFIAIAKASIGEDDMLGQVGENSFMILTTPEKSEKIATFLTYSFDIVAPKFYSDEDTERGYLILSGDEKVGRRIPFVSVSIGITSNQNRAFAGYQEVINTARSLQMLAKSKTGSYWLSDRLNLTGEKAQEKILNRILIIEKDAALAYLLATTLEMQGYIVETANNVEEVFDPLENNPPNLILMDIVEENSNDGLAICKYIKEEYDYIKVIVSTVMRNKEKVLSSGADLYIPKPYELMTLFNWIDRFLKEEV